MKDVPIIPARADPTLPDNTGLRQAGRPMSGRLVSGRTVSARMVIGRMEGPKVRATAVRGRTPNRLHLRGLHHGLNQRSRGINGTSSAGELKGERCRTFGIVLLTSI